MKRMLLATLLTLSLTAAALAAPVDGTYDEGYHKAHEKAASGTTSILYVGVKQPAIFDNAATYECSSIPGFPDGVYVCYRVKAGQEPEFAPISVEHHVLPTITPATYSFPVLQSSCPNGLCPNIIRSFR